MAARVSARVGNGKCFALDVVKLEAGGAHCFHAAVDVGELGRRQRDRVVGRRTEILHFPRRRMVDVMTHHRRLRPGRDARKLLKPSMVNVLH